MEKKKNEYTIHKISPRVELGKSRYSKDLLTDNSKQQKCQKDDNNIKGTFSKNTNRFF
jgi:hypothetical protein